jgi:hypothetical protein
MLPNQGHLYRFWSVDLWIYLQVDVRKLLLKGFYPNFGISPRANDCDTHEKRSFCFIKLPLSKRPARYFIKFLHHLHKKRE